MNDPELFELCKAVYERTGWKNTDYVWYSNAGEVRDTKSVWSHKDVMDKPANVPLYTSDYLLEKLPAFVNHWLTEKKSMKLVFKMRQATTNKGHWRVGYYNSPIHQEDKKYIIQSVADTPLKALLKLTLALSDAGIKL